MNRRATHVRIGWRSWAPLVACGWALAASSACQSAAEPEVSEAGVHAVHSERLGRIMAKLEDADRGLLPQELESESERARLRAQVVELAGAMVSSAESIPSVLDEVALAPEHRAEFLRLSHELRDMARSLEADAPNLSAGEVQLRVQALRDSCAECHTRFRVMPAAN